MTRRGTHLLASLVAGCSVVAGTSVGAGANAVRLGASAHTLSGIHVFGRGHHLDTPGPIATIDGHVWVANEGTSAAIGDSMVEFSAATGAYVRTIARVAIAAPRQLLACDGNLWLATGYGSIVELDGHQGRVERTVHGPDFGRPNAQSLTCAQQHLWVVSADLSARHRSTTVDERSGSTGAVLHRFALPASAAVFAQGIAISNAEAWVTSTSRHPLMVVSTTTGAVVRTYPNTGVLRSGGAVLASGGDVFVVDLNAVVELDARSGHAVRTMRGAGYGFDLPDALIADGPTLLVVNAANVVTQVSTATGALVHRYRGAAYGFNDPAFATRAGPDLWVTNAAGQTVTEFTIG